MPSPKTGTAASLVPPAAPGAASDALDSTSGSNTTGSSDTDDKEKFEPFKPDPKKKSWIEVALVDEEGNPVPGERYQVTLPDGSVNEGTLDGKGLVRIEGFDPGTCQIGFPDLDGAAWEAK
jgi:hypothetical protein